MEQFECKTKIISGPGAVSALAELGAKRLFLVTDPYFAKNGTAERIAKITGAAETEVFDQVAPDPSVALAAEGTARVKAFRPDVIVATEKCFAIKSVKQIKTAYKLVNF